MKKALFIYINIFLFICKSAFSQFAPAPGYQGSTAIPKDSSCIVAWATGCIITRGPQKITDTPPYVYANYGDSTKAIGMADGLNVVSLGDGGSAVLTFDRPIRNGSGYDFAVFENAFNDQYLELAFVEVSSDGTNYFRFASSYLGDTVSQVGSFANWGDATLLNNLAGKYRANFGTPFDLQELNNINGLNIDSICYVKVIDVVGCIQEGFCTRDAAGRKVNDPWPTAFGTSGLDLDAVAVINQRPAGFNNMSDPEIAVYPTVVNAQTPVFINGIKPSKTYHLKIVRVDGIIINELKIEHLSSFAFHFNESGAGTCFLQLISEDSFNVFKLVSVN